MFGKCFWTVLFICLWVRWQCGFSSSFPSSVKEPGELRGGSSPAQVDQESFTKEVAFEWHLALGRFYSEVERPGLSASRYCEERLEGRRAECLRKSLGRPVNLGRPVSIYRKRLADYG